MELISQNGRGTSLTAIVFVIRRAGDEGKSHVWSHNSWFEGAGRAIRAVSPWFEHNSLVSRAREGRVSSAFFGFSVLACMMDGLRLAGMGDLPLYWMFDLSIRLGPFWPLFKGFHR